MAQDVRAAVDSLVAGRSGPAWRQLAGLAALEHRPWPLPERPWIVGQSWRSLAFLHWAVPAGDVRRLVPAALPLDLWAGQAWIGVTPFEVVGHRLRGVPPMPVVSRFDELNVRTYVTLGGRPGIYFLSLDASSLAAVLGARAAFRLPYFPARMRSAAGPDGVRYRSERLIGPRARLVARYTPTGSPFTAAPGTLEHWLTERYCLYTAPGGGPARRAEIHHPPWPLQAAQADVARNTMVEPLGLRLDREPHLLFAARQDVVIWPSAPVAPH